LVPYFHQVFPWFFHLLADHLAFETCLGRQTPAASSGRSNN
jgi:hypothetical protein